MLVAVVREEEGAGAGLAREDVLPVEGRWGLKGLVFEAERSGGMMLDWDIEGFGRQSCIGSWDEICFFVG